MSNVKSSEKLEFRTKTVSPNLYDFEASICKGIVYQHFHPIPFMYRDEK